MNFTRSIVAFAVLVFSLQSATPGHGADDAKKVDTTRHSDALSTYDKVEVRGWTVRVSGRLKAHAELRREVMEEVNAQLFRVSRLLKADVLAKLRKTEIWIEYDYPNRTQYHPDRNWLVASGYIPEKAKTIEIANAKAFLGWQNRPVITLLHELFHAYHDQVLGFDEPRIIAAYEAAKASGKYEKILRDKGKQVRHYGLSTPQEYFAEASEAYLWVNDYYPFVYGELKEFDPKMCELLAEVWGKR